MSNTSCPQSALHCIGLTFGALLLRLWIGMRLLFAGLEKWKSKITETNADGDTVTYWKYDLFSDTSKEVYSTNMGRITSGMNNDSPLRFWMIEQYAGVLGWLLLIVGAWVLIGLCSRASLVAAGFVFLSLTFGLSTIGADPDIVERGIEIGLVVGALALARYQLLGVDGLIHVAMGKHKSSHSDDDGKREKD